MDNLISFWIASASSPKRGRVDIAQADFARSCQRIHLHFHEALEAPNPEYRE